MKRFAVREVETLKTTAAMYDCGCPGQDPCPDEPWGTLGGPIAR